MENEKSKKHAQLPNGMNEDNLTPKDQLVYAAIKSFDNPQHRCFPSQQKIAEKAGISIPTVRKSIDRLGKTKYIKIKKSGKFTYYYFNEYKKFEPISDDLLQRKDISTTSKCYIIASQQYMFKDIEGYGKISFSRPELSKIINMPESTIRDCDAELKNKGFLQVLDNKTKEIDGSGCNTKTKLFMMNKLGQAIIWKLKDHEDRISQNTEDISELQKIVKEQQKIINKLVEKLSPENSPIIMD